MSSYKDSNNIFQHSQQYGIPLSELARRGGEAAARKKARAKEREDAFRRIKETGGDWWND